MGLVSPQIPPGLCFSASSASPSLHHRESEHQGRLPWLPETTSHYTGHGTFHSLTARWTIFHLRRKTRSPTSLRWPSCLVMERRSSPIWLPPFDALENAVSDSFAQEIGTGSLLPQGSAVDWMNFSPCTDHQSPDMSTP